MRDKVRTRQYSYSFGGTHMSVMHTDALCHEPHVAFPEAA